MHVHPVIDDAATVVDVAAGSLGRPLSLHSELDVYRLHRGDTDDERHRLPGMMNARPLALDLWSVAHERMSAQHALEHHHARRHRIAATVSALRSAELI